MTSDACEFCGTGGETRLMWSDEHGRKVRVCRSLADCFDRVTAPIRALSQTSTGVDEAPDERASHTDAQTGGGAP